MKKKKEKKEKPLLLMSPEERERAFDEVVLDLDEELLRSARDNKEKYVTLIMVVLISRREPAIVVQTLDYGDDEGRERMDEAVRRYLQYDLLQEGEHLEIKEVCLEASDMLARATLSKTSKIHHIKS